MHVHIAVYIRVYIEAPRVLHFSAFIGNVLDVYAGFHCRCKPVMGIFMLFTNILPCCCLQNCNIYGVWVTSYCICVQTFVGTCANIS